ncbi:hypothetical protein LXL04_028006 [Taraxacum kok-saghyz]
MCLLSSRALSVTDEFVLNFENGSCHWRLTCVFFNAVRVGQMASRLKEDERNERTIRNLLKLPENRRCINCNSLGPQYVCTSFWTFVCTTCSGIHREFTHRVKSVSMAKFTTQEVSALQGGGNASAKEIYLKEWDTQRQSLPDSSNVERLRDFIKHVYVDRRYSGERSFDKPPRSKTGETEDTYGSRSPPYETDRRYTDRPSPGGRSDTSSRNSYDERRSPEYNNQDLKKTSPARTDIVNDWRREDRFAKNPESVRSPDHHQQQQNISISSPPPVVRPVREILGESVSPLRVIEPPPLRSRSSPSLQLPPQRTASSSSLASSNGNPNPNPNPATELRRESSLIDFDTDPEPSVAVVAQSGGSSFSDNWANFDSNPVVSKPAQVSSTGNLLDVLSELSVPGAPPPPAGAPAALFGGGPVAQPPPPPPQQQPQPFDVFGSSGGGGQWQNVQASQQNVVRPPSVNSGVEAKPAAKQELPADLFSSSYSGFGGQGQGWYPAPAHPQYGMGYNMPYNNNLPMQQQMGGAYGQAAKSANPFDVNESPSAVQPPTFPSMAPLQNALPNMGMGQQTWMMPPQSYGSPMPSGPFMGQPPPNIPSQPRPQVGNFGYDLGSLNPSEQSGLYAPAPAPAPAPTTAPNTFSSNPFG